LLRIGNSLLFYSPGTVTRQNDRNSGKVTVRKNPYSNRNWYFLTVGQGTALPIPELPSGGAATGEIDSYDAVRYHENDLVNFLSSGKAWYGEEFAHAPGKQTEREFVFPMPGRLQDEPVKASVSVVSRSVGTAGRFRYSLNGNDLGTTEVPAVGGGAYDPFAREAQLDRESVVAGEELRLRMNYDPGNFSAQGWLDHITVQARCRLALSGNGQLIFRKLNPDAGNRPRYLVSGAGPETQVWEITDFAAPQKLPVVYSSDQIAFVQDASVVREYIAFEPASALSPVAGGRVANQDLHATPSVKMVIVTDSLLLGEARRLADFHEGRGASVRVVTSGEVYNEFSSGSPDPSAIRNFMKMLFDRAAGDLSKRPKYLLFFGATSYDFRNRVSNNRMLTPSWQSDNSLDPLLTYTSDDFFALLDNGDDIGNNAAENLLDIGVGRIPAADLNQARNMVDKIIAYHQPAALGVWRTALCFIADDEDNNIHLADAEQLAAVSLRTNPEMVSQKIFLDAYPQESTPAGSRYPTASRDVSASLESGVLIWNYTGHGGATRLAEEGIFDGPTARSLRNQNRYPLMITATCDFAPYDNPAVHSLGEQVLVQPNSGAIALMTTTRSVFASSNRTMNENYLLTALERSSSGTFRSLGETVQEAKNKTYRVAGDIINNRKFTLLGDPAMSLAFPQHMVRVASVRANGTTASSDTLRALDKAEISGNVCDRSGNILSNFNGRVFATVYDKKQVKRTLGNDAGSPPTDYEARDHVIFKGKAEVKDGLFSFSFIVPKDIRYQYDSAWISLYAENGTEDACGFYDRLITGGGSGIDPDDQDAPTIKAWLNDEKFVNGSVTNSAPLLIVKLSDSSGINTTGAGIGHDISAVLDNDQANPFVLNRYYEASTNTYREGTVRFQLPEMEAGEHVLTIKAWDVMNNSGSYELRFRVAESRSLLVENLLNYPNPFSTSTQFWFEHNRPHEPLSVMVRVFSLSGKLVKTLSNTIISTGNRSCELTWDGRDDFGAKLARGVYWYTLRVKALDGQSRQLVQKLVIL